MRIKNLTLTSFRSYSSAAFDFSGSTIIVGKNTAGKTNILEGIYFLSHGTSFRAEYDVDVIRNGAPFAKITGAVWDGTDTTDLQLQLIKKNSRVTKKYLVNDVPRRMVDFISHLPSTLFTPEDIELLTSSPSRRRQFLTTLLSQTSREYRIAQRTYEKALKQRNRLIQLVRDEKRAYSEDEFLYWNNLLLEHGTTISSMRKEFIDFVNREKKDIFEFSLWYDHSLITEERLFKYKDAELAAGITLIGPQRDDIVFLKNEKPIREYCSRGEQRLTILQTKLLEIQYLKEKTQHDPILLLDDIFSELDQVNIERIIPYFSSQQTIVTTIHEEFVPEQFTKTHDVQLIEL